MKKILIVEDDMPMAKVLKVKLEGEGFEVVQARDGEEGFKKAMSGKPDLILLDIIMPKMDGITMLKKLHETEWGKEVPVIMLTNLGGYEEVVEELKNGTSEYLIKADWDISDVIKKVKEKLKIKI